MQFWGTDEIGGEDPGTPSKKAETPEDLYLHYQIGICELAVKG